MPTQKAKSSTTQWSVEDIYNKLMLDIEPELVTYMLPELPAMYREEKKTERQSRLERYTKAFEVFAERFSVLLVLWTEELRAFRKSVFNALKEQSGAKDAQKLTDIGRSLEEQ